jgi:peptidoglycan/LPS O-acetylase OafA/YrhL
MQYRREIDGLRALAVIPVILFHAGFSVFSGGYVGVDVFFVISGYLITSIILTEKQAGSFSFIRFYERRARRILPALFFVIAVSMPFAWFLLLPRELKDYSQSVLSVSTFSSNLYFWFKSGYFDTAAELKPLLHTWSLAVEEQFYVFFPILLMGLLRLPAKWVVPILLVLASASFGLAHWITVGNTQNAISLLGREAAFFLLPTRAWELFVGSVIAFYFLNRKLPNKWNSAMSGIGILLIGCSVLLFDKSTPFPSAYTLLPTIGAALIIIFASASTNVGKVLGNQLLVGIGLISYSAYLWHQPLFAFSRSISIRELDAGVLLSLCLAPFVLAYLSWKYVELPFRNKNLITRRTILVSTLLGSSLLFLLGWYGHSKQGFPERFSLPQNIVETFKVSSRQDCIDRKDILVRSDWLCRLGKADKKASFMLFGDSHSLPLLDLFDQIAAKQGIAGVYVGESACPPLLGIYVIGDELCYLLNQKVFDYVKTQKIKKIFLVARWTYYTEGRLRGRELTYLGLRKDDHRTLAVSRAAFEKGLREVVDQYTQLGVEITIFPQVPQQSYDPQSVFYGAYQNGAIDTEILDKYSLTRSDHLALQSYTNGIFSKLPTIRFVSVDDIFCDEEKCKFGDSRGSFYSDDDHLSVYGSSHLSDVVVMLLKE